MAEVYFQFFLASAGERLLPNSVGPATFLPAPLLRIIFRIISTGLDSRASWPVLHAGINIIKYSSRAIKHFSVLRLKVKWMLLN